jgi:hypothetical protein
MYASARIMTGLAALAVAAAFLMAAGPADSRTGSIAGMVVAERGYPIPAAVVQLFARDGTPVDRVLSTREGRFYFRAVPAGGYTIRAAALDLRGRAECIVGPEVTSELTITMR